MNLHRLSIPAFLSAVVLTLGTSAVAFAETDAGSTGGAGDATATADAGSTDAGGTTDTSTPTTTINPCWLSKCTAEAAACLANPKCVAYVECSFDNACITKITGLAQADLDQGQALQKCGGKACTDPTAGSCAGKCGEYSKTNKCNCDEFCVGYGDCCGDFDKLCGVGSCAASDCADGSKGQFLDKSPTACGCGADCETNNDCCDDYPDTCQGKTPGCEPACKQKDGSDKQCGPDNCGGTCGTCKAGEKCVSGACTGGTTGGADAGSSDSTTGGADAGAGADGLVGDTGAATGGTNSTGSTAKSSGCTAASSSTSGSSSALLGVLLMAGAFVALRRRA